VVTAHYTYTGRREQHKPDLASAARVSLLVILVQGAKERGQGGDVGPPQSHALELRCRVAHGAAAGNRRMPVGRSAALTAGRRELSLDLLEPTRERVALRADGDELLLAYGVALLVLGEPRLQLRLPLIELPELELEAGDPLLGGQIACEEGVGEEQDQQHAGCDQDPR
jgi:hypothetical protein